MKSHKSLIFLAVLSTTMTGCGIDASHSSPPVQQPAPDPTPAPEPTPEPVPTPPESAVLELDLQPSRKFVFSWSDVGDANYYRLLENPDGVSGFSQIGSNTPQGTGSLTFEIPLYERVDSEYIIEACNDAGCTSSDPVYPEDGMIGGIGYFKSIRSDIQSFWGIEMQVSGDGQTLIVGDMQDDAPGSGPYSDPYAPIANTFDNFGSVSIFVKNNGEWTLDAYLKPYISDVQDHFGSAVSVSDDGSIIAIGAYYEASTNPSDPLDNGGNRVGAVYVFEKENGLWDQTAYLKPGAFTFDLRFGTTVSLSGDGQTLLVTAPHENSNATGINGNETDTSSSRSGAAWVFVRNADKTWSREAYIKAPNTDSNDRFGSSSDISSDGNRIVIGAPQERSCATNIDDNMGDNGCIGAGAAYVLDRTTGLWTHSAYLKPSNLEAGDQFGDEVSISGNGSRLAVSSHDEAGLDPLNPGDNSGYDVGAVYLFENDGSQWLQTNYLKPDFPHDSMRFGSSLSQSFAGDLLVIGSEWSNSNAVGVGAGQSDVSKQKSGSAYVYKFSGSSWDHLSHLKAFNAEPNDQFGAGVSTDDLGGVIFVNSRNEDGPGTLINDFSLPEHSNNNNENAGAIYHF